MRQTQALYVKAHSCTTHQESSADNMTIDEYKVLKSQLKEIEKQVKDFEAGLKQKIKENKGQAVELDGYELSITIGQQTRCAGHEKFKEVLGQDAYQALFEQGLINTNVTEKLGVKKL